MKEDPTETSPSNKPARAKRILWSPWGDLPPRGGGGLPQGGGDDDDEDEKMKVTIRISKKLLKKFKNQIARKHAL